MSPIIRNNFEMPSERERKKERKRKVWKYALAHMIGFIYYIKGFVFQFVVV